MSIHTKALAKINDSAAIDADYTFKVKELENIALEEPDPEDEIYQEFALTLEDDRDNDIVTFKLILEHETMMTSSESGFSGWNLK